MSARRLPWFLHPLWGSLLVLLLLIGSMAGYTCVYALRRSAALAQIVAARGDVHFRLRTGWVAKRTPT